MSCFCLPEKVLILLEKEKIKSYDTYIIDYLHGRNRFVNWTVSMLNDKIEGLRIQSNFYGLINWSCSLKNGLERLRFENR